MRTLALLVAIALCAGCSHSAVSVGSGTVTAASGTVVTSGSSGLSITTSSGAAALALVLTFGVIDYVNNPQPFPDPRTLIPGNTPPAPPLATNRLVSEQDCSKPVDLTLGNLRCK